MPFYAIVEAITGDLIDVVEALEEPVPWGAIAVELPARNDDMRAWLAAHARKKAGGGGHELLLGHEPEDQKKDVGRSRLPDAEAFFARLDQAVVHADIDGRRMSVLLFDLALHDEPDAEAFVEGVLRAHRIELLPCDTMARVRHHLVGVIMPDVDSWETQITPPRGAVLALVYPDDRDQVELLRRRRHPLLRRATQRAA